jgi:acyl-CoA oxidase
MARLIIDGKDYGVNAFLLQLRDLETHKLLKGVTTGDIGPKMGFNTVDNGYLKLDKVRIPRTNMLMRFAQVSKEGKFHKPPHDKISYGMNSFLF